MKTMTEFNFHTHAIRVFPTDDGNSFMAVAADVAEALEYRDAANLVRCIDAEDVGYTDVSTPSGVQKMLTVTESGVYAATFRSRKASAKPFRRWVTADVLPAIRRTGSYTHPAASDTARNQLAMAQEIGLLKNQLAHRDQVIAAKDQAIMGLQGELIGSLRGQNRLLGRVSRMEKRHAAREAKELVILLEAQGVPREEIAARSGKNPNHIRQIVHQARLAGRLPQQRELNLA